MSMYVVGERAARYCYCCVEVIAHRLSSEFPQILFLLTLMTKTQQKEFEEVVSTRKRGI